MGKIKCEVCGKEFTNKYSKKRHMENMHPKDYEDEDHDEQEDEDEDGTCNSDDEVEVLSKILKEVLEEIEDERWEEDDNEEEVTMRSVDDMLGTDNYKEIAELFRKKVNLYKYVLCTRNV